MTRSRGLDLAPSKVRLSAHPSIIRAMAWTPPCTVVVSRLLGFLG